MNKLRKGDQVVVMSGRDKGRKGVVLDVLPTGLVRVEGINMVKKHQRPNPQKNVSGGIVDKEMALHRSKLAIWNAANGKADRVGIKTLVDGKRVRFLKSNNEVLDVK